MWGSCAILAVVVGLALTPLLRRMPPPYDDVVAVEMDSERIVQVATVPVNKTGPFARNERLKSARVLFKGKVLGSESVAVLPTTGDLVMLDKYGYLHRARAATGGGYNLVETAERLYIGPGRPLGFHAMSDGTSLLVCDSLKGLLAVDVVLGTVSVVANRISATGEPIHYANDLDVAKDGTVYFTSSTAGIVARNAEGYYDSMRSYLYNTMRGDASGRLLAYHPKTRKVSVLMSNISFANGVALSEDGQFVAVVETNQYRVLRYWLRGPRAGTSDVLIDRLPGFPDGISRASDGGFWLALAAPRSPLLKLLAPWRLLRQLVSHAIVDLLPYVAKRWGCVAKLSRDGEPMVTFMDPDGSHVSAVSAVAEHKGKLFMGSLSGDYVSVLEL